MFKQRANIIKHLENANDMERITQLLTWKKEIAIVELRNMLCCVDVNKQGVIIAYLRILPVFFSYVTLYDMEVPTVFRIIEILRLHSAFENCQNIFEQWFVVFKRRMLYKKRFTYKDETCVRDLPVSRTSGMDNCEIDFACCIGYVDIHLLRNFHRWLRLLRLHKYLFFFANLSYTQIMCLNDERFDEYEKIFGVMKITIGAKSKILREIERLRQRRETLENILNVELTTSSEIEKAIREIKRILRTPIPTNDVLDENIPQWLVASMCKVFESMLANLQMEEMCVPTYGIFISLLKEAWNYNIFTVEHKNSFNTWRTRLSDKMKNRNVIEYHGVENTVVNISFPFNPFAATLPDFRQCSDEFSIKYGIE